MRLRDGDQPFKLPGSDSPLKKSTSVTAIIHGAQRQPNNIYYVDSLQRFRRDHASVDKSERDLQKLRHQENVQRRRMQTIDREMTSKKVDDGNYQRMKERQAHSLYLHKLGSKLTIHSHGIPLDPLNHRYQTSQKGQKMQQADQEKRIHNLVRSHHIQTCGTSGYNIINGQPSLALQKSLPPEQIPSFQNKLSHYYEKFRIRLE